MKWKVTISIAALVILLTLVVGCQNITGNVAKEETIKIGFIGPLTGGPATWGEPALNMVNLAIDEINADGGIDGKMIELIVEDGKCNSQAAVSAANKLLDVDKVKFIIGGHCSPETAAITPVIDGRAVIIASITSSDGAVDASKYAFRTSPATLEMAKKIAEKAEKLGYEKIAMITEQAAFSSSFSKDLKEAFNGQIVEEAFFAPGETDFRTILAKIKDAEPDAIWISPQDPEAAKLILRQIKEQGMEDIRVFGNTVLVNKNIGKTGMLSESAWTYTLFADPKKPKLVKLQEDYAEKYQKPIEYDLYYIASTYDATYIMKEAIEKCGEDIECAQQYIDDLEDFDGATGKFTFKENGDPVFDSWLELNGEDVIN